MVPASRFQVRNFRAFLLPPTWNSVAKIPVKRMLPMMPLNAEASAATSNPSAAVVDLIFSLSRV